MRFILLITLPLLFLTGCNSNGYDRHYIVSDALEDIQNQPEESN